MKKPSESARKVIKYRRGRVSEESVLLPEEMLTTIYLNSAELVTMAASPHELQFLAAGFLFTEGIIEGAADIKKIDTDSSGNVWVDTTGPVELEAARRKVLTAGCGKGTTLRANFKRLKKVKQMTELTPEELTGFVRETLSSAEIYRERGGVHSASLLLEDRSLVIAEDIGRHNSIDRVVGKNLLGKDRRVIAVFATGRLSSEMVLKAIRAGSEFAVSLSSPTDAALTLAEEHNVTLVGYARGDTFTIYSHPGRLLI